MGAPWVVVLELVLGQWRFNPPPVLYLQAPWVANPPPGPQRPLGG